MKQNDEIVLLLQALKYFYPGYFGEEILPTKAYFEYSGQKYKKGWVLAETFKITQVPENTSDIGVAIRELERLNDLALVEPPTSQVEASLPGKGLREQQQADLERIEAQSAERKERIGIKTQAELDAKVKAAANNKKLREFKESVKDKTVYTKVEEGKETPLATEKEDEIAKQKSEARVNPDRLKQQIVTEVRTHLEKTGFQGDIEGASNLTADNMVATLGGSSPFIAATVLKQSVGKGIPVVTDYAELQIQGFMRSKSIAEQAFGKEIADKVFTIPESIQVSDVPTEGFTPFAISKIVNPDASLVIDVPETGQSVFFNPVGRPHVATQSTSEPGSFDFKSSMETFKSSTGSKTAKVGAPKVEVPKVSISSAPLRTAVSGITKVFADLFSKGKIAAKGLENSQGLMVVGGVVAVAAGVASGSGILTTSGIFSTITGFAVNPTRVFSGSAFGSVVEPVLGFLHSAMNFVISGIVLPIVLAVLCVPLLVALFLFIINSGALVVPPTPSTLAQVGQVVSPYIEVRKTANPAGPFQNSQLPITVEYTVEIIAKKVPLKNIHIHDDCSVRKKTGTAACPSPNPKIETILKTNPESPEVATTSASVSPTKSYSFKYSMTFNSPTFIDSRVSNSITVNADTLEQGGVTAAGSASIKIGNPPDDCPSDWPVYPEGEPYLAVYQGPHTSNGTHNSIEAIDIFSPDEPLNLAIVGNQVKATHSGKVVVGEGGNYGRFVDVTSMCKKTNNQEVEITTRYAHLSGVSVTTGQNAGKDQVIGLAGSSGTAYPHVHYEFRPAPGPVTMNPPYLPKSIPKGCFNGGGKPCNVTY